MRKLASIRRITEILPIPGADAIEVVQVGGWRVVTKKNEFQVNDLCVYFEIDSVLPVCEQFEFLRGSSFVQKDWLISDDNPTGEGFRLRTIRLRGQISQGLVVPVHSFYRTVATLMVEGYVFERFEGDDVTDLLGVVKWDPPVPASLSGKVKGNFPSFIPKTDQERIQNVTADEMAKYADHDFEVTVKLDGSSMTVFSQNEYVGVCSRNLELDWENDPNTTFAKVLTETALHEILPTLGNYAIQGELMGPGIQGNRENMKDHKLYVFDIYDIGAGRYLTSSERIDFVNQIRLLQRTKGVKCIEHCPIQPAVQAAKLSVDNLLAMAEGPSIVNAVREGLVFKSIQDPMFSFKAISNKWLLKNDG